MMLPTDAKQRKDMPIARGVLDYFPDAVAAIAHVSKVGNDQHNPGEPMHWAREKSTDHADCIVRHLIERGTMDTDGLRHTAKLAWRALALLQTEIEADTAAAAGHTPPVASPPATPFAGVLKTCADVTDPEAVVRSAAVVADVSSDVSAVSAVPDATPGSDDVGNRKLDDDVLAGIRAMRRRGGG